MTDDKKQVSFHISGALKQAIDEYCQDHETGITAVILDALKTQKIPVPKGYKSTPRRRRAPTSYPKFTWITAVIPTSVHHALQQRIIAEPQFATDILIKGLAKLGIVPKSQKEDEKSAGK